MAIGRHREDARARQARPAAAVRACRFEPGAHWAPAGTEVATGDANLALGESEIISIRAGRNDNARKQLTYITEFSKHFQYS